ncbi:MAG: hypothetical protein LBP87_13760 [Planctomycetaceae bacterium]|jgi:hypothetical protein|nr:hypothetical protein [Planctomycetaceae bacterium]
MNREEFLNSSHDRLVREAIHQASLKLIQKHAEEKHNEKQSIEKRFENIEKRLVELELKQ